MPVIIIKKWHELPTSKKQFTNSFCVQLGVYVISLTILKSELRGDCYDRHQGTLKECGGALPLLKLVIYF